ncbi:MAG: PHP domain-containing protein, partial [Anaerolineae bacterium]|nr:PHP domain-containing protein [Anaerolineae bacterium]
MKATTDGLVLAADASIDLQTHTIWSDGAWTPEGLIDHFVAEGFGLAAITDHDRADTAVELQNIAAEKGFPLLIAAEVTCAWKGEMTDMLCYGFDPEKPALSDLTKDVLRRQQENTRLIYDTLVQQGYQFEADDLQSILDQPSAQQPHAFVALMKQRGYGSPERSAGKIITEAGFAFMTVDIAAAVEAGHASGGVCLIAHPGRTDFITYTPEMFDDLRREVPIDGFEVYYPRHTPEQTAAYLA